ARRASLTLTAAGAGVIVTSRATLILVRHGSDSLNFPYNAKWPPSIGWPFCLKGVRRCPTLPQGPPCSTIGAVRLSFRVRNVTGRFPHAMAAETLLMFQSNLSNTQVCWIRVLDRTSRTTQWTRSIRFEL